MPVPERRLAASYSAVPSHEWHALLPVAFALLPFLHRHRLCFPLDLLLSSLLHALSVSGRLLPHSLLPLGLWPGRRALDGGGGRGRQALPEGDGRPAARRGRGLAGGGAEGGGCGPEVGAEGGARSPGVGMRAEVGGGAEIGRASCRERVSKQV